MEHRVWGNKIPPRLSVRVHKGLRGFSDTREPLPRGVAWTSTHTTTYMAIPEDDHSIHSTRVDQGGLPKGEDRPDARPRLENTHTRERRLAHTHTIRGPRSHDAWGASLRWGDSS